MLLVGCLRQVFLPARDFRLALGRLPTPPGRTSGLGVEADPPPSRTDNESGLEAADAIVELLLHLTRRQQESRSLTASRSAAVVHTGLMPADSQR
ncbi:hypothetical protein [Streptomyces virginiae]|uniref:hypothetical protein n=1 Tax=Streptomyces virginiae TaxID=1961 RepID=UPI003441522A